MAHPVRHNAATHQAPRILLQRPKLAALLGCVAADWSFLEQEIIFLYAMLMGRYLPTFEGSSLPVHPVGLQVFDVLETTHTRIELLGKLARWVAKDSSLAKQLDDSILPAVRRAAKKRNKLIHANWGTCSEYPDALIYAPVFGDRLVFEELDFDEAIGEITAARNSLLDFRVEVERYFKANPRWHYPPIE